MKNRIPVPRDARPALPAFDPVPRLKPRHDGWTPARQVAFIEALADTGSVTRAAAQVNMATEGAYALRRAAGAAAFCRAWDAALDMGLLRLKDEAFDRALNGELVPVIAGGKLVGYRRKKNDRLLMFILRHYGRDREGRRTRAMRLPRAAGTFPPATPREPEALPAPAEPDLLADFAGVDLDAEAQAAILAVLEANAARARAQEPGDDPNEPFVTPAEVRPDHPDAIERPAMMIESTGSDAEGDEDWRTLDLPDRREEIAAAVARYKAMEASGELAREVAEQRRKAQDDDRRARLAAFEAEGRQAYEREAFCRGWKDE